MKGPVPEAWHTSTISPQENVNYVTDNVGTAGSQISCKVHGTTQREFLVVGETELDKWYRFSLFRYKTQMYRC